MDCENKLKLVSLELENHNSLQDLEKLGKQKMKQRNKNSKDFKKFWMRLWHKLKNRKANKNV